MDTSIFRYILRYSAPQQTYLFGVIILYYPFLYLSLELPKIIVNRAIETSAGPPYVVPIFGYNFEAHIDQISFLLALSFIYLLLVFVNGGFKYHINVYKGRIGERILRRLRYQLYNRVLRFPLQQFRKLSQGELIPIITAEVEPLGGFIGTAFADPLFFGGQLTIILTFIMVQDPLLGTAAIAFYPLQLYVIPKLQRRVNELGKRRVRNVRRLAEHIGESVSGIIEVRANDTANLELSKFAERLGRIYAIRYELYRRKFFIKFLNNFIDKLTPFFFFSIGGYLVIVDKLSFGALVAVLAAYKDLAAPWKELLLWYQQKENVRIKYEQVIEQFDPPGMLFEQREQPTPDVDERLKGEFNVLNLGLVDDDGGKIIEGATIRFPVAQHTAIVGEGGSGKSELAMILARLIEPTRGKISIDGKDLFDLPESVTGRRIGYVGSHAYLYNASVRENLVYGLKHRPLKPREGSERPQQELEEAVRSGNTEFDYHADWIDYGAAGVTGTFSLEQRLTEVLQQTGLAEDIYRIGLRGTIDPVRYPDVAEKILRARRALNERLSDPEIAPLIEPFDEGLYNNNATVAENLLFGAPAGKSFDLERLAEHPYVQDVLDRVELTRDFIETGKQLAEMMIELFADLPPEHEFFDQYSFISAEDFPEFSQIVERADRGIDELDEHERLRLLALPLHVITDRHRLGLIDEAMKVRILEARQAFAEGLPDSLRDAVALFDSETYCPAATLQDNILFGKLAYGHANAESKIGALISDTLGRLDLTQTVIWVGLEFPVGFGGARLSHLQRQKIAIARCLLKRPDLMIINEATEAMDVSSQSRIIENVLGECEGRGLIWVLNRVAAARYFDHIIVMKGGRIVEQGTYDDLCARGSALNALLDVA